MGTVDEAWEENAHLLRPMHILDEAAFPLAIAVAFGIDDVPLLMKQLRNRDLLWAPESDDAEAAEHRYKNAFQYAAVTKTRHREPVLSTFSYLFEATEPYYDEPYFSEPPLSEYEQREQEAICAFRRRVRANYPDAAAYVRRVMTILFSPEDNEAYEAMVHKACFAQ